MFGAQQQQPFAGFGGPAAASQPAASTSLFGAAPVSLFGAPAVPKPAAPNFFSSTLGSSTAPAPAASTSLFGGGTPAPATGGSLFGGLGGSTSLFGGASTATPAPVAQAPVAGQQQQGAFSKRTKWEELPDGARSYVEQVQAMITAQNDCCAELRKRELGTDILEAQSLRQQYLEEATAVSLLLAQDVRETDELKLEISNQNEDTAKITTLIEGAKSPQTKGQAAKAVASFPFEFFSRKADEFQEKIRVYKVAMDQIQHQIETTHGNERNPASIVPTLRAQHASLMSLAEVVAHLDNDLKALKQDFRQIYKLETNKVHDPFMKRGGPSSQIEAAVGQLQIR